MFILRTTFFTALHMMIIVAFIFVKIGSKRVIGGFTSFLLCLFLAPAGWYLVLSSRRLDDQVSDATLIIEFSQVKKEV
jgi:hypothetical protein